MSDDRKGGFALIAGTIALFATMALHPSGHELLGGGGRFNRVALLILVAHTLAEIAIPVLFLGALALSRRLSGPDRFATAAMVMYGFGLIAGMVAAALSGYVAPGLARRIAGSTGPATELWRIIFSYNGALNQAFARILVIASSVAMILWSFAILKTRALPRGIALYGLLAGVALVVAVGPGLLPLNVHGFGLVVIVQGAWFIAAGSMMAQRTAP